MKLRGTLLGSLGYAICFLALANSAYAKKEAEPEEPTLSEGKVASVEELKDGLKVYHTKKTATLKKSYDLYFTKKYLLSKKLLIPLLSDPLLGDLARWLISQDNYELAKDALKQSQFPEALKLSQNAIDVLAVIPARYPYSSVIKLLPREIALLELEVAQVQCHLEKWAACRSLGESALQKIFGTPDMAYIQPSDIRGFAESCSEETTDICLAWVQKLAQYYPKSTEEFKSLTTSFPDYADEVPKPSGYSHSVQNYKSPDLDQAAIDEAIALFLDGKTKDSIEALRKFTDDFPRSGARFRALYWLAKALKKSGKTDESKTLLTELLRVSPLSYYGLLASLETDAQPEGILEATTPSAQDSDPFLTPLELYKLHRARALLADKALALASIELKDFHVRDGLSTRFLTYLAMLQVQAQNYSIAFPIINELLNRGTNGAISHYFLKMIFPKGEIELIQKYAAENGVDPLIVLSLTKQESAFNSSATSVSGALGLMQLMPTTAIETVPGQIRAELLIKDINVKIGTTYLSKMLTKFQGNLVYAIASYNAGPGAVSRWIHNAPPGRNMLEFIESIPYKETREYVAAIIRNYYWYSKILNPDSAKSFSLDYFWNNTAPSASTSGTPLATPTPRPTPRPTSTQSSSEPAPTASKPATSPPSAANASSAAPSSQISPGASTTEAQPKDE